MTWLTRMRAWWAADAQAQELASLTRCYAIALNTIAEQDKQLRYMWEDNQALVAQLRALETPGGKN